MPELFIEYIVKGVVTLAVGSITTFLLPAIVKWLGNINNDKLLKFTQNMVRAAEQIYGSGTGAEKKEYVVTAIQQKFKSLKLSSEELDNLIEAAVYEVSGAIKSSVNEIEQLRVKANAESTFANTTVVKDPDKILAEKKTSTTIQY